MTWKDRLYVGGIAVAGIAFFFKDIDPLSSIAICVGYLITIAIAWYFEDWFDKNSIVE